MIKVENLVAGVWQNNIEAETFQTVNPKTKKVISNQFQEANSYQINRAVEKAKLIFDSFAETSLTQRINFLRGIQKQLNLNKDEIIKIYQMESALSVGRAKGEFQRTIGQIQEFITLLNVGSFIQPVINTGGPDFIQ